MLLNFNKEAMIKHYRDKLQQERRVSLGVCAAPYWRESNTSAGQSALGQNAPCFNLRYFKYQSWKVTLVFVSKAKYTVAYFRPPDGH